MKGWKDERMKEEEYIESINISLSTSGWKDERMKGDEYRKVSKYKYIYKYFRMKGWKDERRWVEESI